MNHPRGFVNGRCRALRKDGIAARRIASQAPSSRAVPRDRFSGVDGTGRLVSTAASRKRTQHQLIRVNGDGTAAARFVIARSAAAGGRRGNPLIVGGPQRKLATGIETGRRRRRPRRALMPPEDVAQPALRDCITAPPSRRDAMMREPIRGRGWLTEHDHEFGHQPASRTFLDRGNSWRALRRSRREVLRQFSGCSPSGACGLCSAARARCAHSCTHPHAEPMCGWRRLAKHASCAVSCPGRRGPGRNDHPSERLLGGQRSRTHIVWRGAVW